MYIIFYAANYREKLKLSEGLTLQSCFPNYNPWSISLDTSGSKLWRVSNFPSRRFWGRKNPGGEPRPWSRTLGDHRLATFGRNLEAKGPSHRWQTLCSCAVLFDRGRRTPGSWNRSWASCAEPPGSIAISGHNCTRFELLTVGVGLGTGILAHREEA